MLLRRSASTQQPKTYCGYINNNILLLDIDMLKFILALKKYNLKSFVLQQEQTMEDKTFIEIERKFNELVFEIQMQDNKKIIEFKEKLKALKEKLALEKELSTQNN